jgi:hypothetical protein
MNFLENIFAQLDKANDTPVLWEIHEGKSVPVKLGRRLNLVGAGQAGLCCVQAV